MRIVETTTEPCQTLFTGDAGFELGAVCKYPGNLRWQVSAWWGPECPGIHFRTRTRREGEAIVRGVHAMSRHRKPLKRAVKAYDEADDQ